MNVELTSTLEGEKQDTIIKDMIISPRMHENIKQLSLICTFDMLIIIIKYGSSREEEQ